MRILCSPEYLFPRVSRGELGCRILDALRVTLHPTALATSSSFVTRLHWRFVKSVAGGAVELRYHSNSPVKLSGT